MNAAAQPHQDQITINYGQISLSDVIHPSCKILSQACFYILLKKLCYSAQSDRDIVRLGTEMIEYCLWTQFEHPNRLRHGHDCTAVGTWEGDQIHSQVVVQHSGLCQGLVEDLCEDSSPSVRVSGHHQEPALSLRLTVRLSLPLILLLKCLKSKHSNLWGKFMSFIVNSCWKKSVDFSSHFSMNIM